MPEATVLYSVTAVVVLGLVVWVAAVLKTAKEPWARTLVPQSAEPLPLAAEAPGEELPPASPAPALDADATSKATPVALGNDKPRSPSTADDDVKDGSATS